MMEKIKLILVDDHPLVITGIKAMLEDSTEFEIIGDAYDGQQALSLVEHLIPDVLVLDIRMPKLTGIEVVKELKSKGSPIKTLLLSMHDSEEYVLHSIKAGADGYLLKGATKEEIVKAFRIIANGGKYFTGEVSASIIKNFTTQRPQQPKNDFNLTKRELQILNLVLEGLSNQEIADALEISKRTAEVHRFNLMKKMGVKNPMELANKAREYQLG
nr:response regulator transcription factor [Galbibacter marinus]